MSWTIKQKAYSQNSLAAACLVYGAFCWGVIWYPYRLLNQVGIGGVQASVLSYALALLMGALLFWSRRRQVLKIPASAYWLSVVAGWTNLAYVCAVIDGEVMRVMLLFYLSPLWTLLLAKYWLHEAWRTPQLLAIVLSLLGATLMLTDGHWMWPLPQSAADWLALSAGIGFSMTNVMTRFSTHLSVAAKGMLVWLGVLGLSLLVTMMHPWLPPLFNLGAGLNLVSDPAAIMHALSPAMLGWLVVIACLLVSATLLVQYGVTKMPAIQASVLFMTELIVAAVAAYYLANETLSLMELLGGLCIMVAGVLSVVATAEQQ